MTNYGLTDAGFVPMTLPVLRAAVGAAVQAVYGVSFDVSDNGPAGQFIGIMCERFALLWEIGEVSFSCIDPDAAIGAALRAVCKLTGTVPKDPLPSLVTLTLTGDGSTVVASGAIVETDSTQAKFQTTADATIATLAARATTTAYVAGQRVTNSFRAYQCVTAGTTDSGGGPTTTDADTTDGTAHWKYVGEGTGACDVQAASLDLGPVVAVSGDLSVIVTPVGGWSTATNLLDATLGRGVMTDEQLRLLRQLELSLPGSSPADSIRARLLQVAGVTNATVFANVTDSVNVDGMPPHSVEALVQGGADQDILECLWTNVAAGIVTTSSGPGAVVGSVVDSEGTTQVVKFTRPEEIDIYVDITLTETPKLYLGDEAVKTAVALAGASLPTGRDVVASAISARAFIAGVLDVSLVKIGVAPSPTLSTTIPVSLRQLAVYDTSRMVVHSSVAVP